MAPDATAGPSVQDGDEEIDFSDIVARFAIKFDEGLDDVIVVDNVPQIMQDRQQRLFETIIKRFKSHAGIDVPIDGMHIPYGEDGNSKGYIFIELRSPADATLACRLMDDYPFDKRHRFAVNRFTDIEKLANLDEEYQEPPAEEYQDREHLKSWLLDSSGRDQLVMCRNDDVQIAWHNRSSPPEIGHERQRWTESYVQWSPLGTFLTTFHRQGIALWGGASWERFMRFAHPGARLVDFSPNEKYMVTWSPEPIAIPDGAPQGPQFFAPDDEGNRVAVWDVRTGHLLRTFPVAQQGEQGKGGAAAPAFQWPLLKWAGDDKYCARVVPGKQISVYELPTMGLLDKKSIAIEGVVDFEWCPLSDKDKDAIEAWGDGTNPAKGARKPRENMICFWLPEVANQPARTSVMSIPSRDIVRSKNLFNVSDAKIHWHPQGDYLCVKVDRHTKTGKSLFCNFELFRMREKDFPVESVELKDPVTAFAWEPQGSHFAVISSNDPNLGVQAPGITVKTQLNFFHIDPKKGDFRLQKMIDGKTFNTVFWSPKGRHVVVATLGSGQKFDLEWYDVDFNLELRQGNAATDAAEDVKLIGSGEHYGITDLEWDPSGRFVATSASVWRHTLENGYAIWDFKGQELQKHVLDRFKQILWRPRPRSLLSKDQMKAVRRNLRDIGKQFEAEDEAEESQLALKNRELYERVLEEWRAWRSRAKKELAEMRQDLGREVVALPEQLEEEATETVQEWLEEILEETEEVIVG
ncbi:translation initiation factor eIF-3b [Ceraceosorus guamensis]|uniref:Eukaryotic translation initiation factor 3 subunit B n=1 Tax=Ceraceosorus guamensis TaxID=1522189 RepID=A0A316WAG9_9BASI|nr:translation initiation factor eIF-3b [Ceraceosorus guamensis]PWN45731.1 translation initiation factor eIF-3b [Ceraceosorus guamensis]